MCKRFISALSITVFAFGLAACGGGSAEVGGSDDGAVSNTGIFIDSPVSGIDYQTETITGNTNTSGEFSYLDGENVTFSIGDISLPVVAAGSVITPLDIINTQDIHDPSVVNIARLLQSLDVDGDPANGISIGEGAHQSATGMSLDFSSPTFDTDVINLVANSDSATTTLIDEASALSHLQDSLDGAGLLPAPQVGSWFDDSGNQSVISFLDETNYMVVQDIDEIGEPLCSDGMESGTYTWNSATGEFSLINVNDTTGDCGLTSMQGELYNATITVSGDILTLTDFEGSFPMTKVVAADNSLIGSWHFSDSDTNIVITFIDDTRYMVARDKLEIGDPLCFDGMESGTYTWNSETGEFSVINVNDTTGDCGLTSMQGELYNATITVSGDILTLTDFEGSFPISRLQ